MFPGLTGRPSIPRAERSDSTRAAMAAVPPHSAPIVCQSVAVVPQPGDSILVLQRKYFCKMVAGVKDLEIRHLRLAAGVRYVGEKGAIWGTIELGEGIEIETLAEWQQLRPRTLHPVEGLPHRRTWALPVVSITLFDRPVPYMRRQGPVGVTRYYAPVADEPAGGDAAVSYVQRTAVVATAEPASLDTHEDPRDAAEEPPAQRMRPAAA